MEYSERNYSLKTKAILSRGMNSLFQNDVHMFPNKKENEKYMQPFPYLLTVLFFSLILDKFHLNAIFTTCTNWSHSRQLQFTSWKFSSYFTNFTNQSLQTNIIVFYLNLISVKFKRIKLNIWLIVKHTWNTNFCQLKEKNIYFLEIFTNKIFLPLKNTPLTFLYPTSKYFPYPELQILQILKKPTLTADDFIVSHWVNEPQICIWDNIKIQTVYINQEN